MSEKKSTAKEKLLSFTRLKGHFLAGTPLEFSDADFAELESWSDEDCAKVIGLLRNRPLYSDDGLCPWCLVRLVRDEYSEQDSFYGFDDNCDDCGFGERHGFCDDDGSDYSEFILRFNSVGGYLGGEKIKQLRDCLTEGAKK